MYNKYIKLQPSSKSFTLVVFMLLEQWCKKAKSEKCNAFFRNVTTTMDR